MGFVVSWKYIKQEEIWLLHVMLFSWYYFYKDIKHVFVSNMNIYLKIFSAFFFKFSEKLSWNVIIHSCFHISSFNNLFNVSFLDCMFIHLVLFVLRKHKKLKKKCIKISIINNSIFLFVVFIFFKKKWLFHLEEEIKGNLKRG